jgi:hypothetical protein
MRKISAFVIVFVWTIISVVHISYNILGLLSLELPLIFIPFKEKQERSYGEIFTLSNDIREFIPKEQPILLISDDGWFYFSLRYLIYPHEIYWEKEKGNRYIPDLIKYLVVYKKPGFSCKACKMLLQNEHYKLYSLAQK